MSKLSKRNIFRLVWLSLVIVFTIWNWSTFQSHNLPEDLFDTTEAVSISETDDQIIFTATGSRPLPKIIFLQGGLTDPRAYAPICKRLAESGYTTHLLKMDWRLPQVDYDKIYALFDLSKDDYVIGGHSQGAKMAAQVVFENPGTLAGMFLLGTTHPRDIDLSSREIPCLKLYAENDGLASVPEVLQNRKKLPRNVRLKIIEGGNHSQFGYLGRLLMDGTADISLEEQQDRTFEELSAFINDITD